MSGRVVALAGGVGAARLLRGLARALPPEQVTAVVNTGDDREFYGVLVSPDLDIVTYTLAGAVDRQRGYGLEGDTFEVIDQLERLGMPTWFRLGDRDFANSLHRTLRLREGETRTALAASLCRAYGVGTTLLPMSEAPCPTFVELSDGRRVHFEEYLARDGAPDDVSSVDLSAAAAAEPAPAVLEAFASLDEGDTLVLCPSNPVVSIGPILALRGLPEALRACRAPKVGISPIVGGKPVKGPAAQLLRGTGVEVSARGVAGLYAGLLDAFLVDARDADQAPAIEALGLRVAATDTLMTSPEASERVARAALELAHSEG